MKVADLVAIALIFLASTLTLFVLQNPTVTGTFFAETGPLYVDDTTTFYLAEGVALRHDLDDAFAGPNALTYTLDVPDGLYAYLDGTTLVATPAPGAQGTYTLTVTAKDG